MTEIPAKITILGSGTSTGIPVPACSCAVCTSKNPKNKRLRTSALIQTADSAVVIDSGPDFRQQVLSVGLKQLDAVLYTHDHADHTAGIDDLRGFCYMKEVPIPCFASPKTAEELRYRFKYIFTPDPDYLGAPVPQLSLHEIQDAAFFSVAGQNWQALKLVHGNLPILGFRSGNFAYCTDCNYIPQETREALVGTEILIITGLRFETHNTHFTIPQAIEIGKELQVKRTILVHMTHTIDHQEVSAQLPPGVELGYDGLSFSALLDSYA